MRQVPTLVPSWADACESKAPVFFVAVPFFFFSVFGVGRDGNDLLAVRPGRPLRMTNSCQPDRNLEKIVVQT